LFIVRLLRDGGPARGVVPDGPGQCRAGRTAAKRPAGAGRTREAAGALAVAARTADTSSPGPRPPPLVAAAWMAADPRHDAVSRQERGATGGARDGPAALGSVAYSAPAGGFSTPKTAYDCQRDSISAFRSRQSGKTRSNTRQNSRV